MAELEHEVVQGCLDCPHPDYCAGMGKCEIGAKRLDERSAALILDERRANGPLFYTEDGCLVDLREYRQYPVYGEWGWISRTNNSGVIASGI